LSWKSVGVQSYELFALEIFVWRPYLKVICLAT
jgi:hypothetical protein